MAVPYVVRKKADLTSGERKELSKKGDKSLENLECKLNRVSGKD